MAGAKEESKTVADTASVAGEEEEKREEGEGVKGEGVKGEGEDKDYEMEKEEEEEDEMTIQEQERHEEGEGEGGEEVDHQAEIYELNKESESKNIINSLSPSLHVHTMKPLSLWFR